MLVVEYRDSATTGFENAHGPAKKLVPRVKCLTFFRAGIAAVLGDYEHAINSQFRPAERERLFDVG
jgi:hypothetical protein